MSMYRCATCGSPNVLKSEQNDGFSYKKAIVGTAVFGNIGAVAGINGKHSVTYHCPDCGFQSTTTMDDVTKAVIDTLITIPDVFERTNPDLLRRYSYLRKEMAQYKSGNESKIERATYVPESNNPYDITEEQFREATRLFYNTMNGFDSWLAPTVVFYEGKLVWRNTSFSPKPIEEYIKAFEVLPIIYNGLVAYSHLTYNDTDTGNGLSRLRLKDAVLLYVLTEYGNMTMPDLYALCRSNRYMGKVFDVFKLEKERPDLGVFPDWAMWAKNRMLTWRDTFIRVGKLKNDSYLPSTENEVMSPRLFLINGSLYTNIGKEKQFLLDHPEYESEIAQKKAVVDSLQFKIVEIKSIISKNESQTIVALRKQLSEKQESLQTKEQEVERLKKKIFGHKKAMQQAEDIEREIATIKEDIESLEKSIQKQVDAEKKSVEEELNSIRSEKDDADKAYSELLQKKAELLSEYSGFVCYYGPDSTIQVEQRPKNLPFECLR